MTSAARTRFTPAFSLIEVTLSLGVVSFALLSVLALLPLGLKMMQESQQQAAISNILNEVRGQAQQMTQADMSAAGQTTYYDSGGSKELGGVGGFNLTNRYYRVITTHAVPAICTNTFNANNAVNIVVTITYPVNSSGTPPAWAKTITNTIFAARQAGN